MEILKESLTKSDFDSCIHFAYRTLNHNGYDFTDRHFKHLMNNYDTTTPKNPKRFTIEAQNGKVSNHPTASHRPGPME